MSMQPTLLGYNRSGLFLPCRSYVHLQVKFVRKEFLVFGALVCRSAHLSDVTDGCFGVSVLLDMGLLFSWNILAMPTRSQSWTSLVVKQGGQSVQITRRPAMLKSDWRPDNQINDWVTRAVLAGRCWTAPDRSS